MDEHEEVLDWMFKSLEDVIEYLEKAYPDKMVLEDVKEFDRIKLAGKTELAIELLALLKDNWWIILKLYVVTTINSFIFNLGSILRKIGRPKLGLTMIDWFEGSLFSRLNLSKLFIIHFPFKWNFLLNYL